MLGTSNGVAKLEGNEGYSNQSSSVQAVCDWFGPTDLTTLKQQVLKAHISRDILNVAAWLINGPIDASNEKSVEASPVTYVSSNAPPFLIMQGDSDSVVPIAQSQELADALDAKGTQVEFVLLPGYGHDFLGHNATKKVLSFFDRQLKPKLQ
jgi:acetyl esterase/lipase